jgi:protein-S-isoprenylcysteine O-methyltransferase Ste14
MIPQTITAILLTIPLAIMLIPSIHFWLKFKGSRGSRKSGKKAKYKKIYFYLLVAGVLFMWVFWIGGIIFLFLNKYYSIFGFLTFSNPYELAIQIVGLFIFYIGAIIYNLNIIIVGKYLLPSISGLSEDHKLIQNGPFGIIRHPLYVSYILILTGLSLTLLTYWLLIPTLFVIVGIYQTAKAEEELLIEQFGEEYIKYKQKVGMFFPKIWRRKWN